MLKWVDMPPVWLAGALVIAWWQSRAFPVGAFGDGVANFLAGSLVGGGLILLGLAAFEMYRHRTTIIPHRDADKLVTSGIFKRSRNPIYLADVFVLTGLILYWDAVLALVLIPVFVWIIEKRFIEKEERRLRHRFPREFMRYEKETRRWL